MNCNNRIPLDNGHVETYCILPIRHEGKCEPDPGIQSRYTKPQTQTETNGNAPTTISVPQK